MFVHAALVEAALSQAALVQAGLVEAVGCQAACGKVCKAGRSSSEKSGVKAVRSSCASSVGKAGLLKLLSAKLVAVSKLSS